MAVCTWCRCRSRSWALLVGGSQGKLDLAYCYEIQRFRYKPDERFYHLTATPCILFIVWLSGSLALWLSGSLALDVDRRNAGSEPSTKHAQ
jgi:hypothetical protein